MSDIQILGLILAGVCFGCWVGAGLGYYTGYTDALKEQEPRPRYRRQGGPDDVQ